MGLLVKNDLTLMLLPPYVIGTVSGSIFDAKISIFIEKYIGAQT